jgi:replication-associated recombination protein RarA
MNPDSHYTFIYVFVVGLADSQALPIAMATFQACQVLGRPECSVSTS